MLLKYLVTTPLPITAVEFLVSLSSSFTPISFLLIRLPWRYHAASHPRMHVSQDAYRVHHHPGLGIGARLTRIPGYRGWLPGGSAGFLVAAGGANKPVSWCFGPVPGRFGVAQGHFLEGALRAKSPWIDRFCRKIFEGWGCRPRPRCPTLSSWPAPSCCTPAHTPATSPSRCPATGTI